MIRYSCDWCSSEFSVHEISTVRLKNVYNKPVTVHICAECGYTHMPQTARVASFLSWTAPKLGYSDA